MDQDLLNEIIRKGVVAARPEGTPSDEQVRESLSRFSARVGSIEAQRKESRSWLGKPLFYAVAASLFIVAVLQYAPGKIFPRKSSPAARTYATKAGQRARVTLPDGSTAVLAPQTILSYSGNFGTESNRTIVLDGQALFTVTHATGAPFIVNTGNIATRVLGTSFSVRRYMGDNSTQVVVAQGRVSLGSSVLGTGDIAKSYDGKNVSVSRGNAVDAQLAWAEGRLVFASVLLSDVVPEIERWYGINITVADKTLLNRLVTLTIDTETATRAAELVAFSVEGQAQVSGNKVVIRSR